MAVKEITREKSASKVFLEDLYQLPDGKNFKTCIQCGTCSGVCPLGAWMDYTPRKIIHALRMNEFADVLDSETVWMCVSCYACANACPRQIPLTNGLMTRVKEEMLLAGIVPEELQAALENSQRYGNPMGESGKNRAKWAADIEPAVPLMAKVNRPVDVLWYVGDYPSYHPTVQATAKALAKVFNALEIDFGILGPQEVSDGDSQRLAGERGLFEYLAEKNAKMFDKYEYKMIVTTDPHAYNAIKNEYPALGFNFPIQHYTEFLVQYEEKLKKLLNVVHALVAYHDPCYLGRANDIYDEPRKLIDLIPGVELVEMSHSRANSLCCGGGGGGMWLDGFQWDIAEHRLSEWRMGEAVKARPVEDFVSVLREMAARKQKKDKQEQDPEPENKVLAVACPYEKPRFEDAAKTLGQADKIKVKDIAELLAESIGS